MKKVLCCVLCCICFIFSFLFNSFASYYSIYGSVTQSTTQISNLIDSMHNQYDYNPLRDWVAFRSGEYEYCLFYNIKSDGSAIRLRYYGTTSGYTTTWHFDRSNESNFSYNSNNYTIVGNKYDTLGSSKAVDFKFDYLNIISITFVVLLVGFFIFRIKKRNKGGIDIR